MGANMKYTIFSSLARAISEAKKIYNKTVNFAKYAWKSYLEAELSEYNIEHNDNIQEQEKVKNLNFVSKKNIQINKNNAQKSSIEMLDTHTDIQNPEKGNKAKQKQYNHLTNEERIKIATLKEQGYGVTEIGKILKRAKSTISKEIRRYSPGKPSCSIDYNADDAQKDAEIKRKLCGRNSALTTNVINDYYKCMKKHKMSPEQISESVLKGECSKSSFYRGVERGVFDESILKKCLIRKYKRKRKTSKKTIYEIGRSIHERPTIVDDREEFGHWEADSIESKRSGTCAVCVLIERKTRKVIAIKVPEHNSYFMTRFILNCIKRYPKETFKTITCDRGVEFADFKYIEARTGVEIYFADPHSPNQKGSVENANGLIRRFFPKGTDFGKLSPHDLYQKALRHINAWPKKVLDWVSPNALFAREVDALKSA